MSLREKIVDTAGSIPVLEGLRPLDVSRIPLDVVAGATLAALAIPEVMGYAIIAGVPVVLGLYTLLLPMAVFAVFGSSRHLVVGADSATAALTATVLVTFAVPGSAEYVALAGMVALLAGLLLLLSGLLRLGFVADFLSRAVLIGFLTGVGVQVALSQIPGMFGVPAQGGGTVMQALDVFVRETPLMNGTTIESSIASNRDPAASRIHATLRSVASSVASPTFVSAHALLPRFFGFKPMMSASRAAKVSMRLPPAPIRIRVCGRCTGLGSASWPVIV
jgi:hypothetical protein